MKMIRFLLLSLCLVAFASEGMAQQSRAPGMPHGLPPGVTPPGSQTLAAPETMQQVFAMGLAVGQQVEGRTRDMQKQIDDLRAYAVACGDKPGCFTPTPEK